MPIFALPLLMIPAGVVALVLLWPRILDGPSAPRLVAELLLATGGFTSLLYGLMLAAQRLPW
jgi:hypothetical protein